MLLQARARLVRGIKSGRHEFEQAYDELDARAVAALLSQMSLRNTRAESVISTTNQ